MDLEHHIQEVMAAEIRNLEHFRSMDNDHVIFGGGGPRNVFGEPRQEAAGGRQGADGIGAGMQSMLNQIQAENQ